MKISAITPRFGAKRTLAPHIVRALGPHRVYWEPFCGSMAVLLAKEPCVMETVSDLDGHLTNLARVIQDERLGPQLYRRLRRTLMHETLHAEARERHIARGKSYDGAVSVDAAYDYLLTAWVGRNGTDGTGSYNAGFCVRYTGNGGHAAKRFVSAVESIPAWRRRLRHVTILRRSAFDLLPRIDDAAGTAIYVDPPYLVKGAKYIHDLRPEQHELLAGQLARFKRARVVVSYYDHPELDRLYPGWHRETIEVTKALVNQGMRDRAGPTKAREVLLVNGPLDRAAKGGLFA